MVDYWAGFATTEKAPASPIVVVVQCKWCSAMKLCSCDCALHSVQLCVELRINCATLTAPAHILHQLQLIMECEEMCKKI